MALVRRTIKREIHKFTAVSRRSPPITPVRASPTRPPPLSWPAIRTFSSPPLFFYSSVATAGYDSPPAKPQPDPAEDQREGREEDREGNLPSQLARWAVHLTYPSSAEGGKCGIFLIGVIHNTKTSCEEVRRAMNHVKPQLAFLELCEGRRHVLDNPESEMHAANEEAKKLGCEVVLGDQHYRIPLTRFPQIMEAYVDERDLHMVMALSKCAKTNSSIVAIVGAAHLPGMEARWKRLWGNENATSLFNMEHLFDELDDAVDDLRKHFAYRRQSQRPVINPFSSSKQCPDCSHSSVRHFCWWNRYIANAMQARGNAVGGKRAMVLLKHKILKNMLLGRTKKGSAADLALPPRIITLRFDTMDIREEDYFTSLYNESQSQFHTYVEAGTVINARDAAIKKFTDDPDCKIFLVSLKAGGIALNLTVASRVGCIFYYVFVMDPWWKPAVVRRAQDRIHRIGQ